MPGTKVKERQPRDVTINLRANQRQRALIDRAAETLGKNRSDFMLEAACREANAVLLDRRFFLPDEKAYGPSNIYPVVWYSTRPASVTRREASRISSDTRSPAAS